MGMNVLIVDDSSLTRKAIRRIVDMIGLDIEKVFEAENGVEALKILDEAHIQLVLADLNMPEMGGIEMIYYMRGNEATRDIPVVIVSTESSTTVIEGLLADGAKDYLHKPFTPEEFREVLTRTVGVQS
ncbi:MAG TPA: response regulator [Sedimentisphaerales bacterium]|nr:response regulator [Sedimentisphaerales bacterium]